MNTRSSQEHTDWCAQDHRCGLGEHRSHPITHTTPGAGSTVITRIRTATGTEHAEVRLTVDLPAGQEAARQRLAALLTHLQTLIGPPRLTHHPHRRAA
jgi:hypothetical protein